MVERKRTPAEIREEYERLQREREERRLQQRTNPKVHSVTSASHPFATVTTFPVVLVWASTCMGTGIPAVTVLPVLNITTLFSLWIVSTFTLSSTLYSTFFHNSFFQSLSFTLSFFRAPSALVWMPQTCLTATMRTLKSCQEEAFLISKLTRCTFLSP